VPTNELTERLAELTVAFGANVQPGQIVAISADVEHAPIVQAVARSAYRHGARFVDVDYFDPYVKRARIEHAPDDTLEFVPSWYGERILQLGEQRCARIVFAGATAPGLFDDLDPSRSGRDMLPRIKESGKVVSDRTTNWCIVPYPTPGWAGLIYPDAEPAERLERLSGQVAHICRLDEPDPVAAWRDRIDATSTAAAKLNDRRFDALHFEGPGTDLTIGLLPSSTWANALFETVDGIAHLANLPTEEVFTSPDPERADGVVRATKPLVFPDGGVVRGLSVRFEGGRAVAIDADEGAENLRRRTQKDDGGVRLGEVALVDREGRIGPLDTIFYDTLVDENAASHIALGDAFAFAVTDDRDRERLNSSAIHYDFMIGADDVAVTGITAGGERVPVLRGGAWQL
jgi:aminopeptidase